MPDDDELLESASPDPWAGYLPGPDLVPVYLVSKLAAQYRTIVEVLLEAQETSLTGVGDPRGDRTIDLPGPDERGRQADPEPMNLNVRSVAKRR